MEGRKADVKMEMEGRWSDREVGEVKRKEENGVKKPLVMTEENREARRVRRRIMRMKKEY